MPYHVGAKGSYGCSGYPALKDSGEVMGCHTTRAEAAAQIYAINQSEGNIGKAMTKLVEGDFVMCPEGYEDKPLVGRVEYVMTSGTFGTAGSEYSVEATMEDPAILVRHFEEEDGVWKEEMILSGHKQSMLVRIDSLMVERDVVEEQVSPSSSEVAMAMYDSQIGKAYAGCGCPMCKELDVTCENCPVCKSEEMKSDCCPGELEKQAPCWDGYVQRGMKPGDNGKPVPNCVPAAKADDLWEDDDTVEYDTDTVSKAEGYSPPAGARSAARRAIKFKEDGKANGAGTAVGWTRAGQLARGETISLSTVKRMYSYFSRHEVDKKGKDWGNTANPSNGYIMWLAWGGDAGFSWSRGIVNREKDKALFSDFGKDYTRSATNIFRTGN